MFLARVAKPACLPGSLAQYVAGATMGAGVEAMTLAQIRSEKIVADGSEQARTLLQAFYPGVSILPVVGASVHIDLQIDFLDGMNRHRLSTTTGLRFCFPGQFDGYLLAVVDEGALELELGRKWRKWRERRVVPACVMVDALRASCWLWRPGRYEILLVDATRLHTRLARLLERPVVQHIEFDLDVPPDAPGICFTRELLNVARMCASCEARGAYRAQEALRNLQDAVLYAVLEAIPHNYSTYMARGHAGPSPRHVHRAADYIRANARSALSLADIAKGTLPKPRTSASGPCRPGSPGSRESRPWPTSSRCASKASTPNCA